MFGSCNYNDVVWGSDLNWDSNRGTYFASRVKEFVDSIGLIPLCNHHPVDYTHVHTDSKSVATLDHFLLSPRLLLASHAVTKTVPSHSCCHEDCS